MVGRVDVWHLVAKYKIGSYKADMLMASPKPYAIACFHGNPKPHEIAEGWVHDHWI